MAIHPHTSRRAAKALALGLSTAVAAVGLAAASSDAATVDAGSGSTYELISDPNITWYEAKAAAEATNLGGQLCTGHLATITSEAENSFVKATFGNALQTKWLGGYQPNASDDNDGWTWVTGETWGYTQWGGTEPNNIFYGLPYERENALAFLLFPGSTLGWNDAPANWNNYGDGGYLVEYDCRQVMIDIKPGSFPNSINNDGNGVIPVAILTTETFDAATVDPFSVTLDGAGVRVKGKSGNAGSLQDVDGDGDLDLVVQILDVDGTYVTGVDSTALLSAETYGGQTLKGTDSIRLVPA